MKVAIRTDASTAIGSGHLMRCLTLAEQLKKGGAEVLFVTSDVEQKWVDLILERGFECRTTLTRLPPVKSLRGGAKKIEQNQIPPVSIGEWTDDVHRTKHVLKKSIHDWIIVDHYGLDWQWESAIRGLARRVLVIDDLANRHHACDYLLDCVYGRKRTDYQEIVTQDCELLLGSDYALLRPEFLELRDYSLDRKRNIKTIKRILISLGGVDQDNLTGAVLEQLQQQLEWIGETRINVVVGRGFAHRESIERLRDSLPMKTTISSDVKDMAKRIANADIGIGAFGVSTWERFCLGLPSVNLVTETNQSKAVKYLRNKRFAGILDSRAIERKLVPLVDELRNNRSAYLRSVERCSQAVDGKGLGRVVRKIQELG